MRHTAAAVAALLAAALPAAAGTLEGRIVTLNTLTYDDPGKPLLESRGRTVKVGPGVEFGLGPEYRDSFLDVVPVIVEIGPTRIEFRYPAEAGSGEFWPARFNGYVLRFETECALFEAVAVDRAVTTIPMEPGDVFAEGGALYINVEGQSYGPEARLALDLSVADCPLS
jgi:hypothetical protein